MPDGIPPVVNPDHADYDPLFALEVIAKAVFANRHGVTNADVAALLDADPALWAEFDAVMDEVAVNAPLTDDPADLNPAPIRLRRAVQLHNAALACLEDGEPYVAAYQIARERVANQWQESKLRCAIRSRYHAALGDGRINDAMHLWDVLNDSLAFYNAPPLFPRPLSSDYLPG